MSNTDRKKVQICSKSGLLYKDCSLEEHLQDGGCNLIEIDGPVLEEIKTSAEVSTWVDKSMYPAEDMEVEWPTVSIVSATADPLGAIAAFCRMYEGKSSKHLGDISDKERRHYWEQVKKTHLKAPLEAVDIHFFVEGVTRAFTHQMVRQRTAVYAQESLRFAVKDKITARPGPSIQGDREKMDKYKAHMEATWELYQWYIANGVPAEDARGILPHDTLTRLNYKTNLRNLLEHAGNRLCTQAQFEWRLELAEVVKQLHGFKTEYEGRVEKQSHEAAVTRHHGLLQEAGDIKSGPVMVMYEKYDASWQWELIAESQFKPVCFQLGHCPYTAEFDRGCTIRERVEAGKFDDIKPEEWLLDPKAAWQ